MLKAELHMNVADIQQGIHTSNSPSMENKTEGKKHDTYKLNCALNFELTDSDSIKVKAVCDGTLGKWKSSSGAAEVNLQQMQLDLDGDGNTSSGIGKKPLDFAEAADTAAGDEPASQEADG